jgi:hypothetical protein
MAHGQDFCKKKKIFCEKTAPQAKLIEENEVIFFGLNSNGYFVFLM